MRVAEGEDEGGGEGDVAEEIGERGEDGLGSASLGGRAHPSAFELALDLGAASLKVGDLAGDGGEVGLEGGEVGGEGGEQVGGRLG